MRLLKTEAVILSMDEEISFRRKVLGAGAAKFAGVGANFLVAVLLTRILPPRELGTLYLLQGAVLALTPLGNFSLQEPSIRALASARAMSDRAAVPAFIKASLCFVGTTSAFVAVALAVVLEALGRQAIVTPILTAGWILVVCMRTQTVAILQGVERIGAAALCDGVFSKAITFLLVFILWEVNQSAEVASLSLLPLVLLALIVGEFASLLTALAVTLRELRRYPVTNRIFTPKDLFTAAKPFILQTLFVAIANQSSVFILGTLMSADHLAVYGTAFRLSTMLAIPASVVIIPLAPSIARLYSTNRLHQLQDLMQSVALIPFLLATICTSIFLVSGGTILSKLFGPTYESGKFILLILSAGQCVSLFFGPCQLALGMIGRQSFVTKIGVVAAIGQIVISIVLVRPLGGAGVAIGALFQVSFASVMGWWMLSNAINVRSNASFRAAILKRLIRLQ